MYIPLDIVVFGLIEVITCTGSPCPGNFQSFLNMDEVVLTISEVISWELELFQISFLFRKENKRNWIESITAYVILLGMIV